MGTWTRLSDADLAAKIARYTDAIEARELGESTKVLAGEGRREEFFAASLTDMKNTLAELLAEQDLRDGNCAPRGGAIGLRFTA